MLKVGITGNIGTGKTTVLKVFSSLGVPAINADDLSREVLLNADVTAAIRSKFGNTIFNQNQTLNRKKLADIVFRNSDQLAWLNNLMHPAIFALFEKKILPFETSPYVLLEAAILFDGGYDKNLNEVIVVSSPLHLAERRVMERDACTRQEVRQRVQNQLSQEEQSARATYVVVNDGLQMIIPQVMRIHQSLLIKAENEG